MQRPPEGFRTVYLIARREFWTRVRTRFFIIGTIALMALLAGYIVLQAEVISRSVTTVKIGFAGDAQSLAAPLEKAVGAEGIKVKVMVVSDPAAGRSQVRSGSLDAFVSGDASAPDVAVQDMLNPSVEATLNALVKEVALTRALANSGTNPALIESSVASANIHLVLLDPNATERTQRVVVGIFVAALLYVALLVYGQFIAAGVVEEKANRIIEILLSTVRPRQLMMGKVLGIGLMGLVQLVLLGAVGLITISRTQAIVVPSVGVTAVLGGLLWFVLGFLLFALVYAAGGSMVTRQEDLGAVLAPITMVVVGTYLAYFWVAANPNNPIGVLLSIIPPFSPILMPGRMATGDAQAWQVALSVALMVAAIVGMNRLAARIYANSVMRVGTRVSFADAWRGIR